MFHRRLLYRTLLALRMGCSMLGCGPSPLHFRKNSRNVGPWCGPNQRVQIGQRVVGHVGFGENKWKNFLVDDAGKEYEPEELAEQVWSYLEKTGDAKTIKDAFSKEAYFPRMALVSVKTVVVILEPEWNAALRDQIGTSPKKYHWLALISAERYPPAFKEGLQWFSPELKQRLTSHRFSGAGVAEIAPANGTLKLIREGDTCRTERE
ncbi:MAG: hypothetical protein ACT4QC_01410 [Planctomycetaceae bacterium]